MNEASDNNNPDRNASALGDQHQTATRAAGTEKASKDEERGNQDESLKKNESKAKDAARDKDNLDEGLEESMDGSDPPSSLQP
jgi:autotransporter adhesin